MDKQEKRKAFCSLLLKENIFFAESNDKFLTHAIIPRATNLAGRSEKKFSFGFNEESSHET